MNLPPVLSFDLDDTLWAVGPVIAAAERELYDWMQNLYPEAARNHSIESMRDLRARVARQFPEHSHDLTFLRRQALAWQFGAAGYADSTVDQALEVFLSARNRVQFYPDVRPSLLRLSASHRLFALSNGNADLALCGIADLFEGHVTARSAGAAKPDARIFAELLERAGVGAGEVLHVGDDPHADVAGAIQAGLQAVWINRDARTWPAHLGPPVRTVTTLAELI